MVTTFTVKPSNHVLVFSAKNCVHNHTIADNNEVENDFEQITTRKIEGSTMWGSTIPSDRKDGGNDALPYYC